MRILVSTVLFLSCFSQAMAFEVGGKISDPEEIELVKAEVKTLLPSYGYDEDSFGYSTQLLNEKNFEIVIKSVVSEGIKTSIDVEVAVEFARVNSSGEEEAYGEGFCSLKLIYDESKALTTLGGDCDDTEWDTPDF